MPHCNWQPSRSAGAVGALLDTLHGNSHWLAHYLTSEVLAQQSPAIRQFLLQTSILDAFNAALCEAVTGASDAYGTLAAIEQADLFLIHLDDRREWFRYHHLFQELLQHCLQASLAGSDRETLHRRAAAWLAEANQIPAAVRHLRATGEAAAAVDLVSSRVHAIVLRDPYQARQWLDLLPQQLVAGHLQLMLDRCRLETLFDYRYQQIAEELVISVNTVRTHVRHIYEKLGVHRRAQAIERARGAGLILR